MAHSAFDYQFSPHAAFYGTPPRFHHLHLFGILMSYKMLPLPSKVIPQQAQVGIFLGFSSSSNACLLWDPPSDTIVRSLSVRAISGSNYRHFHTWRERDSPPLPTSSRLPSPPPASPIVAPTGGSPATISSSYSCSVRNCTACFLEAAYDHVRTLQSPMDSTIYAHHDACAVCATDGLLFFLDNFVACPPLRPLLRREGTGFRLRGSPMAPCL